MWARAKLVIDTVVPMLVAAVIGVGESLAGGHDRKAAVILGMAAAAVLWGRQRYSVVTLAASVLLVAVLYYLNHAAGVIAMFAPAVALYSLALRRGRRTSAGRPARCCGPG